MLLAKTFPLHKDWPGLPVCGPQAACAQDSSCVKSLVESDTPSLVPCSLQDQRKELAPAVATWRQWQAQQGSFLAKKLMVLLQQQIVLQTKQAEVCILCSRTQSLQPLPRNLLTSAPFTVLQRLMSMWELFIQDSTTVVAAFWGLSALHSPCICCQLHCDTFSTCILARHPCSQLLCGILSAAQSPCCCLHYPPVCLLAVGLQGQTADVQAQQHSPAQQAAG